MPSLKELVDQKLKEALKSRDELCVSTLRLLRAAVKNKEIELIKALDDEGIISVIRKMVKQRQESIEQFLKGNRKDLADKEQKEIHILEQYLPKLLDLSEVEKRVQSVIQKLGITSVKQMGEVMKAVGQDLAGQADMKEVSRLVREKLSKLF
ncbi:MAG: GatB/YqeY domain-containing protein [Deltaproteobacteria bacterium]|nr:GatB/YqeY domain-containing protein [Deltaproteobacteria bacterium]MBI3018185.1 GatB/YqeY domain-containing protein [Deltaproteobacteria bacterium]